MQREFQFRLNGGMRTARFTYGAMKRLGIAHPTDGEGMQRVITAAMGDFGKLAELVHACIAHEGKGETVQQVEAWINDWVASDMIDFINSGLPAGLSPTAPAVAAPPSGPPPTVQ